MALGNTSTFSTGNADPLGFYTPPSAGSALPPPPPQLNAPSFLNNVPLNNQNRVDAFITGLKPNVTSNFSDSSQISLGGPVVGDGFSMSALWNNKLLLLLIAAAIVYFYSKKK